ncbi:MAG: hypothetical protein WC107_02245 [Patescibacteria group bacterium]
MHLRFFPLGPTLPAMKERDVDSLWNLIVPLYADQAQVDGQEELILIFGGIILSTDEVAAFMPNSGWPERLARHHCPCLHISRQGHMTALGNKCRHIPLNYEGHPIQPQEDEITLMGEIRCQMVQNKWTCTQAISYMTRESAELTSKAAKPHGDEWAKWVLDTATLFKGMILLGIPE